MSKIRIAIAGLGNCASSLLRGIEYRLREILPWATLRVWEPSLL